MVAVATDRARASLFDRRLEQRFRPNPAKDRTPPIRSEILLPDGAPERWRDRETLWNEVEARENRRDAGLAREVEFALPAELEPTQASALARDYALAAFVSAGMVADLNVHWPPPVDGQAKPYAQVLLTLRRIDRGGFGFKETLWNDRANVVRWRRLWADTANARLTVHGHATRIDHRSHAERGLTLEPQNKIGANAARRARRGEPSERVQEHEDIAGRNRVRRQENIRTVPRRGESGSDTVGSSVVDCGPCACGTWQTKPGLSDVSLWRVPGGANVFDVEEH